MAKQTLVFDVEGTIIDKTGKVDPKVLPLFLKADLEKTTFVFLSGSTEKNTKYALKMINDELIKVGKNTINAYIAAYSGGEIYNPRGKLVSSTYYSTEQVFALLNEVRQADSEVAMFFHAQNHSIKQKNAEISGRSVLNDIGWYIFRKQEAKKGDFGIKFDDVNFLSSYDDVVNMEKRFGPISTVYVIPLGSTSTQVTAILDALKKTAPAEVYPGFYIEVAASTKEKALEQIISLEKDNPDYANTVEDCIYFGDGANDVALLKRCNRSYARGEGAKKVAKEAAKACVDECTDLANELFATK